MISYINLKKQYLKEKKNLNIIFNQVLASGNYVGGEFIENFEKNISKYCKVKYCISLNSGTDALTLALHVLGIKKGDEVITVPNSFIATASVIMHLGAKPVFVDVLDDQNINPELIEKKITKKTKAIIPVHLTGRVCQMDVINKIAKKYNLKVIEDSAQAIGSMYNKKKAGTLGDIGCFSAHPLKNLNAIGDSGYLLTNSKHIYNKIRELRNHGMTNRNKVKNFGYVSRMDNLQAAILDFRLKNLDNVIYKRRKNFELYKKMLNKDKVFFIEEKNYEFNSYHTFVVQVNKRDALRKYLLNNGVETSIHYPLPIHLQPAARRLGYKRGDFPVCENQAKKILTLPINQFLTNREICYIANKVNQFFIKEI